MYATQGEYKGHALVQLWNSKEDATSGKMPALSLGARKVKIILENLDSLKVFAQSQASIEAHKASVPVALPACAPMVPSVPRLP